MSELENGLVTSRGKLQPQNELKPEDFASMRDARIQSATLAEVANYIEGK